MEPPRGHATRVTPLPDSHSRGLGSAVRERNCWVRPAGPARGPPCSGGAGSGSSAHQWDPAERRGVPSPAGGRALPRSRFPWVGGRAPLASGAGAGRALTAAADLKATSKIPGGGFGSSHVSGGAGPSPVQGPWPVGNNPAMAGSGRDELTSFPSYFIETKIVSEVQNCTSCKILLLFSNALEC